MHLCRTRQKNVNHLVLLGKLRIISIRRKKHWSALEKYQLLQKKTRLLKISRKTNSTVKEAKCNYFSNVFSICMIKPKKLYKTPHEMTGKKSVKTNLSNINENKDTIYPPTVIANMFNKKLFNYATTVEGPTTQELRDCIKTIDKHDDNMFVFPTNMTEVFNTVGDLRNKKAVGINVLSAEVLRTSVPANIFIFELIF